ncbi:MAG TPA: Glu/Leu/Phe/Val dehydrogenase dimerization domain-containing protein [Streptosporangiaceae bacterium]|nr:Glu/Leu/Phe/Val dehydrogenase dimerization domain-containing protein [Streptosporangiaceae bacterium]
MDAPVLDYMQRYRFKKLVLCNDSDSGLRAVIAIHSTALGPATGGTRMWTYPSEQDAIMDALRLARGMTYKYAAAGLDLGGGKAVIIGDPKRDKSEALLRAFGRMVDQLGGEFQTGEDVGTTLADMEVIYSETDHVVTLPVHCGGAGDISSATALGSVQATRACLKRAFGSPDLRGRRVALQGLGAVGSSALQMLAGQGAEVVVCDVDEEKVAEAVSAYGVKSVAPEEIYDQDVDVFGPYALGGVINPGTVPRLRARVVAGSANNIFADEARDAALLDARGIVYAVDYIANSGGTILDTDRLRKGGLQRERAMADVRRIYERIEEVFALADEQRVSAYVAANRLAEARIAALERVRLLGWAR